MEWVDGVPLYDWARMFRPSAAQQLRLLAQVALTLQYLHAQGALHRDLKGGNLLVRRSDSRLFLMDFGSGIYPDADTLTPQQLPPGTPAYRSPEAWLFSQRFRRTSERYRAGPADDVYALGVTACVLATGKYPEMGALRRDDPGHWYLDSLLLPRALFSAQVAPPQRDLILRMLSIRPEERITAAELAPALERAADSLTPRSSPACAAGPESVPAHRGQAPASHPRTPVLSRLPRLALAVAAGALATWAGWMTRAAFLQAPEAPPRSEAASPTGRQGSPDAGQVGLGEAATSAATSAPVRPSSFEPLAAESPPEPSEGQAQPDKKGRCPHPRQVILSGGCWLRMELSREECEAVSGQLYQGGCYVPILTSKKTGRPTTSGPGAPR
jgi:hypothetical protein